MVKTVFHTDDCCFFCKREDLTLVIHISAQNEDDGKRVRSASPYRLNWLAIGFPVLLVLATGGNALQTGNQSDVKGRA